MNILSLFDGMSCGQIALNRIGVKYNNYFASEIDKNAIKVTQHHYPNTIQLGDVTKIEFIASKIDLLIGGSPCQSFSSAGNRNGFDGKSGLFWEYVRVLNQVKPTYFLLENVVMKKEWEDIITKELGVEPIKINSSLVSAQNRVRLYWTNIPGVGIPEDRGITLDKILEIDSNDNPGAFRGRQLNKATILGRRLNELGVRQDYNTKIPYTQCLEVRASNMGKSNCLTTVDKDNVLTPLPIGRHPNAFKDKLLFRYYSLLEYERLQTIPEGYTNVVSTSKAKKMIGNAWTVDVIAHIFENLKNII
jgi:DNA (cytosine-5)-methyltransferase 3A